MKKLTLLWICLLLAVPCSAEVIFVDADAPGANNGNSWADAYNYLQDAIAAASSSDEIRVAEGIYKPDQGDGITPGDREATFQLKNGVAIKGGYAGFSEPDPDARDIDAYETILSGDLNGDDGLDLTSTTDNSSHVVTGSGTNAGAVLDGFTVTASRRYWAADYGGGMYNVSGSPTLANCTFTGNSAARSGGGMYNHSSSPTLTNCTFSRNRSGATGGGGLYNDSSSPTLINCAFIENSVGAGRGGGMCNVGGSSPMIISCMFAGNSAGNERAYSIYGGGGGLYNLSSTPTLINCTFSGNSSVNNKGGGMRNYSGNPTLTNCTFNANSASNNDGGGIYNDAGTLTLTNCILWGNSDIDGADESAQISGVTPLVSYSCIQGLNIFAGGGNIGDDPLFMDAGGTDNIPGTEDDNLRLWPGSPCADAGDNSAVPPAVLTDFDGDPRFVDDPDAPDTGNGTPPIVDMGAYEGPKQGFLVSTKSIIVPEGGTATFTVALAMDPLGTVPVTVAHVAGDPDITVESGALLTFDSSNYSQPQTVTLAAAEDWDSFYGTATIWVSAPGFATYAVIANEGDNESAPNVFYVDGANGDDDNDGLTRETAFATIQKGIDTAQRDGDIVIVADGTYASEGWQNNPVIDFLGKAITVRSENGPENCILRGGDYVVYFHSGETAASVLSGFTITGADPGGGIGCYDSSPTIMNNIITENWSEYGLGAVWLHNSAAIVAGNLIVANDVYGPCAGIYCCHGTSGTIINNTIVDNGNRPYYMNGEGGVYCDETSTAAITNCIFWNNNGDYDLYNCSATYSCTEHGEAGIGNIHTDPMFVNPNAGDYHLQSDSPCIDAGDNSAVLPSMVVDIDGNSRISNGTVDMGAYEFGSTPPLSTLFVDSRATGANNGSSWVDAFPDLQEALTVVTALPEVEEIRVAQGVYTPAEPSGDRTATFQLINGLTIKGGYAGVGAPDPDARDIDAYETILSGDLHGNDIDVNDPCDLLGEPTRAENSFHVVTSYKNDETAVLSGFTITGGNANGSFPNYNAGGMYNDNSNPTVSHCTFLSNSANNFGGGMCNFSCSRPTLTDCTFSGNGAHRGGGMYGGAQKLAHCSFLRNWAEEGGGINTEGPCGGMELVHCTFTGNTAIDGGGMVNFDTSLVTLNNCTFADNTASGSGGGLYNSEANPKLTNCTFSRNTAVEGNGGGMYSDDGSRPTLTNCTFEQNSAVRGGGMYCSRSSATLTNCEFTGNSATMGGGMSNNNRSPTLNNCIFSGNSAANRGGGMDNFMSSPTLTNCTFSRNSANSGGGISSFLECDTVLTNSIVWGNTATRGNEIYLSDPHSVSTVSISYSNVKGGTTGVYVEGCTMNWGPGNINADPCFVDPANGDYHLLLSSPCVNTGDPNFTAEPDQTDIDGHPRVIDGRIDMGADEVVIALMKFTPQALNPLGQGNWVKAHLVLPAGFTIADVNTDSPATLEPLGIQSDHMNVSVREDGLVEVGIFFDRSAFCGAAADGLDRLVELTVVGVLTSGQYFYGTDTIRIITNNRRYLALLASHWLEGTCGWPDWCSGVDLNHSSTVDFVDFAMFDGCCIEVSAQ